MIVSIFGTTYRDGADLELERTMGARMAGELAKMPGFISLKTYRADDGDVIVVMRMKSRADLKEWRDNVAHRGAWGVADRIYHEFWVQNAEVFDDYVWIDGAHHDGDQTDRFAMSADQLLARYRA